MSCGISHERRPVGRPTAAVRVALTLGLACLLPTLSAGCAKTGSAQPQAKAPPAVTVAKPAVVPIVEWDEFVGRLAPLDTVEVRSRVSGYLTSTNFVEGQIVKAGDLLAVIDQRPFKAEVARNEATLASEEAQLGQAEASVAEAKAERQRADIRRDLAQKVVARTEQLRMKNATTQQEVDVAAAELAQSEADISVSGTKIESAQSAVVAAKAAVGIAQANLDLAKLNLQYTEVHAPITGRISSRYVTEGNLVSGGTEQSTLLTTIVSVDPIHCYFDADEQTFLKYDRLAREGKRPSSRDVRNPVYLALSDERDGFPHEGHMDFVENRLDQETGTIRGRAILPNKDMSLTPGLFARVRIPGSPRYDAVMIPDRAVGTDQAEKFVLIVNGEKKVERRLVILGPMSHGLRIIRSGLTGDEMVVLSGQQRARPGSEVTVTVETITPGKEPLPDEYIPVPEEKWLTPKRNVAANVVPPVRPDVPRTDIPQTADNKPLPQGPVQGTDRDVQDARVIPVGGTDQ